MLRRLALVILVAALLAACAGDGLAAQPSSGTVSMASPATRWDGMTYSPGLNIVGACPPASLDPANTTCDHFSLNVAVDPAFYKSGHASVKIAISWADPNDDFDLFVYDAQGNLAGSSTQSGTTSESVSIANPSGVYEVRVEPSVVSSSGYTGAATLTSGGAPSLGGPAAYRGQTIAGPNPDAPPANGPVDYSGPPLVLQPHKVGRESGEPTIAVDKRGTVFFPADTFDSVGGEARNVLLRSRDDGKTWEDISPRVAGQNSHPITLDTYLHLDKALGRLFTVDTLAVEASYLSFADDVDGPAQPTYTTSAAPAAGVDDHETLTTGVVPAGSGLTTSDPAFPRIAYYCINTIAAVGCSRSTDGGRTFVQTNSPFVDGRNPICSSLTGHLITDPAGRVFLPSAFNPFCGSVLKVAISADGGNSWKEVVVSPDIHDAIHDASMASDSAGNLYIVWQDDKHHLPYLAVSRDHGATWSAPRMIAPPGVKETNFPSIDAGSAGRIAISFPGTTVDDRGDTTRPWSYYVTVSNDALSADPLFVSNVPIIPGTSSPIMHRGNCTGRCGGLFDFLDIKVAPVAGEPAWASLSDDCTGACVTDPHGASDDPRAGQGIAIKAVAGSGAGLAVGTSAGAARPVKPRLLALALRPLPGSVRSGSCTRFAFRATTRIHGRRRVVAGATVTFRGRRARTDRHGLTHIRRCLRSPGRYGARARKSGYRDGVAHVRARPAARFTG